MIKLELERDGFYRLVETEKPGMLRNIGQFIFNVLISPFLLYQWAVGRFFSNFFINATFRKDDQSESLVKQHDKYPDPLFEPEDEMFIINVLPKKHIFIRLLMNWHNFFTNNTVTGGMTTSLFRSFISLFPSGKSSIDKHISRLVSKVNKYLNTLEGEARVTKLQQIHFRGLEQLSTEQQTQFYNELNTTYHHDFRKNKERVFFYRLQTLDNAELDSVEIRGGDDAKQDISERHFIIACMPRSNNYLDWIKQHQIFAKELDVTVIGFNYRGIGLSKGIIFKQDNLYSDAKAQIQRLLKLGANPENISVMGECLGGNVAAHSAGSFQQNGIPIKLYNARSFHSMTSMLKGRALISEELSNWNPKKWGQGLRYALIHWIAVPLIKSASWALDVKKEFLATPKKDKDYLVVRSRKNNRLKDDTMVSYKRASFYSLDKKNIPGSEDKKALKRHKFHVSPEKHKSAATAEGHTALTQLLKPTHSEFHNPEVDGREYAFSFFRKLWKKKEVQDVPQQTLEI